jgi:GAF domain-containing protein
MTREELLGSAMVELADTLVSDFDLVELLHSLTGHCVSILDAAAAGVMIAGPGGELRVVAASDERTRLLELFELQRDEGPCLDCYRSSQVVTEPDLANSGKWPVFRSEAMASGFLAAFAVPLRLRDNVIGALNLFRAEQGTLTASDLQTAQVLADIATIGLLQERAVRESRLLADQLQSALNSRIVLEQAKGMLAEHGKMSVDEAFNRLRGYSRDRNLRLQAVAQALTTGALPPDVFLER